MEVNGTINLDNITAPITENIPPFIAYFCGCRKVYNAYYCPKCGFAHTKFDFCREHGEMKPCWAYEINLFHSIEGLMNAIVYDYHLIQDKELLEMLRKMEDNIKIAGIVSALLPLLTPLKIYSTALVPNSFKEYSSNVTLIVSYKTEKPLVTIADAKLNIIHKESPKIVWEKIYHSDGFKEDVLNIVGDRNTLFLLSKKGKWHYKIARGRIMFKNYIYGIVTRTPLYLENIILKINNISSTNLKKLKYLQSVGMHNGEVYCILDKKNNVRSAGICLYDNILPPIGDFDE
ncbi:hypothetical protein [Methanocaldococcus sp.]